MLGNLNVFILKWGDVTLQEFYIHRVYLPGTKHEILHKKYMKLFSNLFGICKKIAHLHVNPY